MHAYALVLKILLCQIVFLIARQSLARVKRKGAWQRKLGLQRFLTKMAFIDSLNISTKTGMLI